MFVSPCSLSIYCSLFFFIGRYTIRLRPALLLQDPVRIDQMGLSENAIRSMAGNGMNLACAGFIILMTVLNVEDK